MMIEYDTRADALYIRLSGKRVKRSVELDDQRTLDFDAEGNLRGIEILYVSRGIKLEDIAEKYGLKKELMSVEMPRKVAV